MSTSRVFTCPACGKGSTSDADAEDGYCGLCRAQTGIPVRLTVGPVTGIIGHLARESDQPIGDRLAALMRECTRAFADAATAIGEPRPPVSRPATAPGRPDAPASA